jgi:hypothetical protein
MESSEETKARAKIDPNEGQPLKKNLTYFWKTHQIVPDALAKDAEDI